MADQFSGAGSQPVFLTGATGYLGAFLLHRLLLRTDGPVLCLVRGASEIDGHRRLMAALARYDLPADGDRIVAIPGDLTKPDLGLAIRERQRIETAGQVIHCAANTNFLFGAALVRNCNLEGTRGILDLALRTAGRRLHYVSSASIFLSGQYRGQPVEEEQMPGPDDLRDTWGYQWTKWQSEQLVHAAAAQGLHASISRPWFIGPHSVTGTASDHDFMLRLIDGCLALGMAPAIDLTVNIMPVDYVAPAIVELALGHPPHTAHLGNPHTDTDTWSAVIERLNRRRPVATVPYSAWRAALRRATDNPAWIFLPLLPEEYDPADTRSFLRRMCRDLVPRFAAGRTGEKLAAAGLSCPSFTESVLDRYLSRSGAGSA